MFHVFKVLLPAVVLAAACVAQAGVLYSENAGGQQVWITGDAFTARSMEGGAPNYVDDPAANDPLSGSAYYFPTEVGEESGGGTQRDWWAQYEVPTSSVPGHFDLTGTWGVWIRTQIPKTEDIPGGDHFQESDWMIVNGDPDDLNVANPTEADWWAAVTAASTGDDRVLQDVSFRSGHRPAWIWLSHEDGTSVITKDLAVIDGKVTFRLYEREDGPFNARVDVICLANSIDYAPVDADFRTAVPEPATVLLLLASAALFIRRR